MLRFTNYILLIIFSVTITGCLKEEVPDPENINIDGTAVMLMMLEETGNVITSDPCPLLISADDLYEQINSILILDFRTKEEYQNGHIANAVNMESKNLLSYLKDYNISSDSKIACVDANGQSSAYYAGLLRLYGYSNVFSLNFGMASWNMQFAGCWLNAIKSNIWRDCTFTDTSFPKRSMTTLPSNTFPSTLAGYDERIKYKISELLNRGFADTLNVYDDSLTSSFYIICYSSTSLYFSGVLVAYPDQGHGYGVVNYDPTRDFYSSNNLQTLPADKQILIYCYNGQLSAATMAYLKVLGYNVKTLLYGGEYLFHARLLTELNLKSYLFTNQPVKNYPFVK